MHIAYNENKVDLNALVKLRVKTFDNEGKPLYEIIETTVGRIFFNEVVPAKAGFSILFLQRKI